MADVGEVPPPFELLEHTADIGLRSRGRTLEELFENAARGLAAILEREAARPGAELLGFEVDLEAADLEGLLVTWMDEVLYLLQERNACLGEVRVGEAGPTRLRGHVEVALCADVVEGTELKAATYHQLAIGEDGNHRWATVFFDV